MIVTLQNIMVKNLKNIIVRKAADCAVEGERSPMLVQPGHNFFEQGLVWSGTGSGLATTF